MHGLEILQSTNVRTVTYYINVILTYYNTLLYHIKVSSVKDMECLKTFTGKPTIHLSVVYDIFVNILTHTDATISLWCIRMIKTDET